ncbi:threonylcarbamoyl-AMP synthase-like [Ptychodera flava]|uniref:threonylcarbamoyl-AMP synthase-like n=1 Tax=Ptychodera flava TaxID=63121 RepID=UPI00396A2072
MRGRHAAILKLYRVITSYRRAGAGTMANIIALDSQTNFSDAVAIAAETLKKGSVIALPTDTIYGVAALAQSSDAVQKLYNLKGRNQSKPIAICVSELSDIAKWGKVTVSDSLLGDLLPGPVTMVLERTASLNPELNPNTDLVGIRIPKHDFIRRVCAEIGEPLALTSANISAAKSTLCIEEFQELWPKLDAIFDGGTIGASEASRLGSTVVDLSQSGLYQIIRPGSAYRNTVSILEEKHGLKETR